MRYGIGLDIGIASVGFAVTYLDENENAYRFGRIGTRIFDTAEQSDGASLAAPRRMARSARRRNRRRRHRKQRIYNLLYQSSLLDKGEAENLFVGNLENIYALRVRALDELITPRELARILIHISQRRGFKSNRKAEAKEKEAGLLLAAIEQNKKHMDKHGYRTVGEMLLKDPRFELSKRNKDGQYINTVQRDMVEDEVKLIFARQRDLGSSIATESLEEAYLEILLSQRSFDEGPGEASPYAGNQIEKMVGTCTFLPEQKRAPKASYSFELFTLLQNINHIRLSSSGEYRIPLTQEQRMQLLELAHRSSNLTYSAIRKALSLDESYFFQNIRYDGDRDSSEKKEKIVALPAYHEMRKALSKISPTYIRTLTTDKRNDIAYIFSFYKTDSKRQAELEKIGLTPTEIECLIAQMSDAPFKKTGHLSVEACDRINEHLMQGLTYDKACDAAGFDFRALSVNDREKSELISLKHVSEKMKDTITSPVVKRAVSQTLKVLNAIIREMGDDGELIYVNIELARELSKTKDERRKIEKDMKANRAQNEALLEELRTTDGLKGNSGLDLVKLKLWKQQDGRCMYSLKPIERSRLFESGYAEIDHIIPYSRCFDDSYKNKVLVLTEENRKKGNRLPLEYISGPEKEKFVTWVKQNVREKAKQDRLLRESFDDEDQAEFTERNLTDTKTIASFLHGYLLRYLKLAPSVVHKKQIRTTNGAITGMLRRRWGLEKIRSEGDLHHAMDACVIAVVTDDLIRKLTLYSQAQENRGRYAKTIRDDQVVYQHIDKTALGIDVVTGELVEKFPLPWRGFRKEIEARLSSNPGELIGRLKLNTYTPWELAELEPIFVSRMPDRKITGAAHQATVRSQSSQPEWAISKVPLTKLKLDKNGEIANYYDTAAAKDDRLLYEALKARLQQFGGNGAKAFAEPFYKPKKDGTPGPLVKKVKIEEKISLTVPIHCGTAVAKHDKMIRIDVFYIEGDGYYFVPIYVADRLKDKLPNRAVIGGKPSSEWKEMQDDNFVFSLYKNDLLFVRRSKPIPLNPSLSENKDKASIAVTEGLFYYRSADISTASITCITHDNTFQARSLGIKTLHTFEKWTVDMLGNVSRVRRESRRGFDKEE